MRERTLGRYLLGEELGRGGMSVVYRAQDPVLDRGVAIKVLHPHLADRADARARFTREAKAIARLKHRFIVEVFDFSPPESDEAYIVTELIEGPTLRQFMCEHPLQHSEVAALIMRPIFVALEVAHSNGIVHRDVKPENIMIRTDGTLVLMDFGIAQMVDMETLTATGTMLGSPAHMAPEIVEGAPVGHAADIFSAGTVLYWLICGALPFTGPNPAALFRRIVECRFDPVLQRAPKAGRDIARITERCLAQDPRDRPQSAGEVAELLGALLKTAGLERFQEAQLQLFSDPEVYQDNLKRRMLPAYLAAAQEANDAGQTATALNLLTRLLSLDKGHPEGLKLLKQIERGQRRRFLYLPALASMLIGCLGLGIWAYATHEPELTPPDAGLVLTAVGLDGGEPLDAGLKDRGLGDDDAQVDAFEELDFEELDFEEESPRVLAKRKGWMSPRKRRPKRKRKDSGVARSKPAPKLIPLKIGSADKGAMIFINGKSYGEIAGNEQGKIKLPPGNHKVEFRSTQCKKKIQRISLKAGQLEQKLSYACDYRPAFVHFKTRNKVPVLNDLGARLGNTNQDISIKMKEPQKEFSFLIGNSARGFHSERVGLRAGKTTVIENVTFKKP